MQESLEIRQATTQDLQAIAEVFLAAFPESVEHYVGHPIGPQVMVDVFAICLEAEPRALLVGTIDGVVSGYVFAPRRLSRVFRVAVFRGHIFRLLLRWLTFRYGIGLRPAVVAVKNWLALWHESRQPELHSDARIFSVAVHPDLQGQGLGGQLVAKAVAYLESLGAHLIRLEVRPGNEPAIRLYERVGFVPRGTTKDTQGEWLIMLRDLRTAGGAPSEETDHA